MSLRLHLVLLGLALFLAGSLPAQTATNAPAPTGTNANVSLPISLLMLPSPGKSPVDLFRELLAMNFFERRLSLTNRPPGLQKLILAKLREYETLKPDERELRLKVTELRWYLYPLMTAPLSSRTELLNRVPAADRPLVESRLAEWDKLPPDAQKELLKHQAAIESLSNVPGSTSQTAPPKLLERKVQQWQALPEEHREKLLARFDLFFKLTPEEKDKVLRSLSEPARRQIEKTLDKFAHLTPGQRARCIQSFEKFTNLSPTERQEFLKNAERWTLMTPDEREKWCELVKIAPMLPPSTRPPRPPLPPGLRRPATVATNGH